MTETKDTQGAVVSARSPSAGVVGKAGMKVLSILADGPIPPTGLAIYRIQRRVLDKLREAGLVRFQPYAREPSWRITAAGRALLPPPAQPREAGDVVTKVCPLCKGKGAVLSVDAIREDGTAVNPRPAACLGCDGAGVVEIEDATLSAPASPAAGSAEATLFEEARDCILSWCGKDEECWGPDERKIIPQLNAAISAAPPQERAARGEVVRKACAALVEKFPHWLGSTGRAEIAAAIRAIDLSKL